MVEQTEADAWAKLSLGELRHYPDRDLEAEISFTRREIAGLKGEVPGLYWETQKRRLSLMEIEQSRRRMLADSGGGPVARLPRDFPKRIEWVKANIDIVGIVDLLNIPTATLPHNSKLQFRCPVHGDGSDRNPSGVLYVDQWRYWCFGCNAGGSGFDLVMAFGQARTFLEAIEWLERHIPAMPKPVQPRGSTTNPRGIIPD